MPQPLAIGIDLGSSSVRALLFDPQGGFVGGRRAPLAWHTTPEGGVETDPESLVRVLGEALDGALLEKPADAVIRGVGVSAFWHTLVGVDETGRAVTPLLPWSDTRARDVCATLRGRIDEAALHRRTGAMLHPSYVPPRLAWLRRTSPALFERAAWWLSAAEYVGLRLFGERVVARSMASASGLMDQRSAAWDGESLEIASIDRSQLSPVVESGTTHRAPLRREFATRWPELARVPWLVAVGDGACANLGSGCVTPDRMALSLGTSAAVRVMVPAANPEIPARLWAYRYDEDSLLIGGALSNGGNVHRRLRELLRLTDDGAALEAEVDAIAPDARGIDLLPFFAGERSPDWPLDASALIRGLTLDTTPAELLRAGMEAVAYRLALLRRLVLESCPEAREVVASGSPLRRSPTWARIITDVLGEPVLLSEELEASARGAALLALHACGDAPNPADAPPPAGRLLEPDPVAHERYLGALQRHLELEASVGTGPSVTSR